MKTNLKTLALTLVAGITFAACAEKPADTSLEGTIRRSSIFITGITDTPIVIGTAITAIFFMIDDDGSRGNSGEVPSTASIRLFLL